MGTPERIRLLLDTKNVSQSQLARDLGVSKVAISKWINTENSFGIESVKKLLTHFPDLNARWLLLGTGEMLEQQTHVNYSLHQDVQKMVAEEMAKYDIAKKDFGKCG